MSEHWRLGARGLDGSAGPRVGPQGAAGVVGSKDPVGRIEPLASGHRTAFASAQLGLAGTECVGTKALWARRLQAKNAGAERLGTAQGWAVDKVVLSVAPDTNPSRSTSCVTQPTFSVRTLVPGPLVLLAGHLLQRLGLGLCPGLPLLALRLADGLCPGHVNLNSFHNALLLDGSAAARG